MDISQLSTVKVTELEQVESLDDTDKFYVVAGGSRQCTYSTIKAQLDNDLNISNISSMAITAYNNSYENADNISAAQSDINQLSTNLTTAQTNITTLQATATGLRTDLENVSERTNPAAADKYGTIKIGFEGAENDHPVKLDPDGKAYVTVAGGGGGSGEDTELREFVDATSSIYTSKDGDRYIDKVTPLNGYISELCNVVLTGDTSLSIKVDQLSGQVLDLIYAEIDNFANTVYCVGSIYTSTSASAAAISYLTTLFEDSEWSELTTDLAGKGIHFYQRTK